MNYLQQTMMNEVTGDMLLEMKLEPQEITHTVMRSIIDEFSATDVKDETTEENQDGSALKVQRLQPESSVVSREGGEHSLNMKRDVKDKTGNPTMIPANLKEMQLVRDESGLFKCICCWKGFLKKQQLQNHLKIHIGEKNFECEVCRKRFTHKQQLGNHFKIHTGEKNFECELCNKRFTHKQQLQNHVKTHTGIKDFECSQCPKRFTLKQQLQNHLKVHAGLKLFKCEFCEKSFTLKQQLGNHLKIHLGIKDFLCCECNKQFRTRQQLDRHLIVHSHEKQGMR